MFFLIGNFAGGSTVNPRIKVETDDSGAFSGSFPAPDPLSSADPRAPRAGVKTYDVSVRCLGPDGEHSSGAIVSDPPKFTFTDLVPVARCDVYWVKPGRTLKVKSPGVLANDYDPRGLSFRGEVDRVSFRLSSNAYSFNGRTGTLRFKPGPKTTRAVFTYHITNSRQVESRRTKITVYVQPRRPSVRQLDACKGSR